MSKHETITLHNVEGFSVMSGTDDNGCTWMQFEVDYFAEQEPGVCAICGAEIEAGYMCMDGGDEVCEEHISWDDESQLRYIAERS